MTMYKTGLSLVSVRTETATPRPWTWRASFRLDWADLRFVLPVEVEAPDLVTAEALAWRAVGEQLGELSVRASRAALSGAPRGAGGGAPGKVGRPRAQAA